MMKRKKTFAVIGAAGYIAPRHLQAIKDTGNRIVVAYDTCDSVGILDKYALDCKFFTAWKEFIVYLEENKEEIDYVSVCSPNFLHNMHIQTALTCGINVICEKPLVLNPKNLNTLKETEKWTGKRVYTILQLRKHPEVKKLKEMIENSKDKKFKVNLVYITPRGDWYHKSWKGEETLSGGLVANIGVHLFDLLIWLFGSVKTYEVYYKSPQSVTGNLSFNRAEVEWLLSVDRNQCDSLNLKKYGSCRLITAGGEKFEFTRGFSDLHTEVYRDILKGNGLGIDEVRPSIELIYSIRKWQNNKIDEK